MDSMPILFAEDIVADDIEIVVRRGEAVEFDGVNALHSLAWSEGCNMTGASDYADKNVIVK